MNKLCIPPSPNWYSSNILACASDNTVIYGSRNDIVVIYPSEPNEAADIKMLGAIHTARVSFVSINANWGNPNKWAVSVAEDNVVHLIDVTSCTSKISHVGHKTHGEKVVGAVFSGEDKVVSVSEKGFIIIWKLSTNNLTPVQTLASLFVKVSTISSCPHAPWIIACGLKKGGIMIVDLKKPGRVLHRINAHEDEIISLSWCPTPYNVIPQKRGKTISRNNKTSKPKEISDSNSQIDQNDSIEPSCLSEPSTLIDQLVEDADVLINSEVTNGNLDEQSATPSETILKSESVECNPVLESDFIRIGQVNVQNGEISNKSNAPCTDRLKNKECCKDICDDGNVLIPKSFNSSNVGTVLMENVFHVPKAFNVDIGSGNLCKDILEGMLVGKVGRKPAALLQEDLTESTCSNMSTTDEGKTLKDSEKLVEEISDEQVDITDEQDICDETKQIEDILRDVGDKTNELEIAIEQDASDKTLVAKPLSREFLLASASRGSRFIKIWRAGTDGLLQTELWIPQPYQYRSYKSVDKGWIALCWATPTDLLSSSRKGQLLLWNVGTEAKKDSGKGYFKYRTVHADHSKYIFCIATPLKKFDSVEENWREENVNAWTLGNDRFLLSTNLYVDNKNVASYTTIGGSVTCLVPSPIDPTRLACGMSDGYSKIWDLSQPHLKKVILKPISEKQLIKASCFVWHPTKEDCLAYGTSDGEIGLIDMDNLSKAPTQFPQSAVFPVHHLQWGPLNDGTHALGLYGLSNTKLVVYDPNQYLNEPKIIECCTIYKLTSFSWKPDCSVLAVATKDYELLLFNKEFKLMNMFILQNKTVRFFGWHPLGTPEDNWLAIASNQVIVYDCSSKHTDTSSKYEECAVAVLNSHQRIINSIIWSPHQSEFLATASEDGSATVWNVKTKTLLHTCHSKFDLLYAVLWSPFDPEYIITGGRCGLIRIWKLSENPPQAKLEKVSRRPALALKSDLQEEEEGIVQVRAEMKNRKVPKCFLNGIAQLHNVHEHVYILSDCKKLYTELYEKDNNENDNDDNQASDKLEFNVLKLFGDKDGIGDILKLEKENHLNRTTKLSLESVFLWQGDIGEAIRNAIKCDSLNAYLISVAPMVSHTLWQEACEAYAKQLMTGLYAKPVEAAFYYLTCHKVEESIQALRTGLYFREALILAKCRLSPDDPIINEIIEQWAHYSTGVGKFEIAAQCYLVLNKLEEAAKVLFRRSDIPTLEFCVTLAEKSGNKDLLDATLFRLNAFKNAPNYSSDTPTVPLKTRLELELNILQQSLDGTAQDTEIKTEKNEEVNDASSNDQ